MKSEPSKDFYKSLFDNAFDGIAYCRMIFDVQRNPVDFICLQVNKNFEKLLELKDATGKKATELLPNIKTSNPELFEIISRVAVGGKPERFEIYIESASKWFLVSVYSPQKEFFVVAIQNITVRKLLEKRLENAKIAARNVLEDLSVEKTKSEIARIKEEAILLSVGDGLLATDEEGNITLINKAAEILLGQKRKQVTGKLFYDTIIMEDNKGNRIPSEKHPINKALKTGATTTASATIGPIYYVRKGKTKFPAAVTVTPIVLAGKALGAIAIFRNITREKEVDKAKNEFVSLASHQLKTPITGIKLLTERLLGNKLGDLTEKQKEYINDIHISNERMINLVNTLLNISRIELGTFSIQVKKRDACAVVQSVLGEMEPLITKKNLKLKKVSANTKAQLMLDEPLFRMVIGNLITNAVRYTDEGGKVQVEYKLVKKGRTLGGNLLKEDCFVVVVSDTGYGIPKAEQNRVFSKFFRADNARVRHPDGTGLGLYIIKSILDYSGGAIWFTSQENKGSVFYVAIPMTGMRSVPKKEYSS